MAQPIDTLWAHHHAEFRDPDGVVSQWQAGGDVDPQLLRFSVRGKFWEALAATKETLIVTREYEHLVIALSASGRSPRISCLRLPHPNGIAVIKDKLFANAVGMNAVVELPTGGGFKTVWWPRCIDGKRGRPLFGKNYLQLNSIATRDSIDTSCFSASAAEPSARRPGHLNFPVDGCGVIFYGRTREVVATGLTRPHSARFVGPTLWVDNSGYGEVGYISGGRFEVAARLPGWTRGLGVAGNVAFVGTSRVIPRYACYAPGVDIEKSKTGIHALDLKSGRVLGSILWPRGNQIFGVELARGLKTSGFPMAVDGNRTLQQKALTKFYFSGVATK